MRSSLKKKSIIVDPDVYEKLKDIMNNLQTSGYYNITSRNKTLKLLINMFYTVYEFSEKYKIDPIKLTEYSLKKFDNSVDLVKLCEFYNEYYSSNGDENGKKKRRYNK